MASRDLHSNIKTVRALSPVSISDAADNAGEIIDTNGFESVEFVIATGTVTDGSFTPKIEHGAAANLSDAAEVTGAGLLGTIAGATFVAADDDKVKRLGYLGGKRYVRLTEVSAHTTAATGTATLGSGLAVDEKVTIESHDFVCKDKYAKNSVTCAAVQAADTVTVAGVVFTAIANGATPTAHQFPIGAGGSANADTATAIVAALTLAAAETGCTATANTAVVTITASTAGAAGNDITLATSNGTRLAITTAGGKLAGAYIPASDQWPLESTLALSATALAHAIATSATAGITGVVTASAADAVVTITAVAAGTDGNALTFTRTGSHITASGSGTLAGGVDAAALISAVCVLGHPMLAPVP